MDCTASMNFGLLPIRIWEHKIKRLKDYIKLCEKAAQCEKQDVIKYMEHTVQISSITITGNYFPNC